MKHINIILLLFLFITSFHSLTANERRFTYIYETLTMGPGLREIEIWNTFRTDKNFFYHRLDQRVEFEFGITNRLMSSLYLNSSWSLYDSNEEKTGGETASSQQVSVSSEWKLKLLDRTADPIGLGIYSEATFGLNKFELEGKLLLDKQLNKLLIVFNGNVEHEWESQLINGVTSTEKELQVELDLGLAYFITGSFTIGIETRNPNIFMDGTLRKSAFFAGPVVSYASENWWATLTILPQITSFKGKTAGNLILDEYEKTEARLIFSLNL